MRSQSKDLTSNALAVVLDFVAVHADFVTPDNSVKIVLLAKPFRYVWTKLHPHASLAWSTARLILWIRPKHFHHQTRLARLPLAMPVQIANVVQGDVIVGKETPVKD